MCLASRGDRSVVARWRLHVITPAIGLAKHSDARAAAIRKIAAATEVGPDWQPTSVCQRTVERWLHAYERQGIVGLMPKVRKDKGIKRVMISQRWDWAVRDVAENVKLGIASELHGYIRGLEAKGHEPGQIQAMAREALRKMTASVCDYAAAIPGSYFEIPRPFIDAARGRRARP